MRPIRRLPRATSGEPTFRPIIRANGRTLFPFGQVRALPLTTIHARERQSNPSTACTVHSRLPPTDKSGRDFRGRGRLNYVGKHHLQFAETGEFFLKTGVDAPENFLAYQDFDGDFKSDGQKDDFVKDWGPHLQDWQPGDPTWQNGKGKGIIGAVNYLASEGLNSFSFLTLNIIGDDRNVFPYTKYDERVRIDCSRMDQWEIVFAHGNKQGMYLHFKTQEAENVNLLDNGNLGPERKLYYRELTARFAHHLALNWNLGEEVGLYNKVSTEKKVAWADYFWTHDPYQHHIVIHNGDNHFDLLGNASRLTGFSLQTNQPDFRNVHSQTLQYIRRSVAAGKPWVVACDEPGDATHALLTDAEEPAHDNARRNALWGNIMAGGAGVEWYFGYKHPHSDLTCQDFRVRQNMWKQCRHALQFFADQKIPFWNMTNANEKLDSADAYCLHVPGKMYLVYRKYPGELTLNLSGAEGVFEVLWFNPRDGGPLQPGSAESVRGGDKVVIGTPPSDPGKDWLAVIRRGPFQTKVERKTTRGLTNKSRQGRKDAQSLPFAYDPTKANKVHKQTNGMVVVEAEEFDAADRQVHRQWLLTTAGKTPEVKPNLDPNHAAGASGGAYLEILPDTRVTHADSLVDGVSFTNTGSHTIMFSMREDGFEFDKFLLTPDQKPMESKSGDLGPPASPRIGH